MSRLVFGQKLRLEVIQAIAAAPSGCVTLTSVAQDLGVAVSSVQAPIKSLVEAGLLEPQPATSERERPLKRVEGPFWGIAVTLADLATASGSA